MSISNTRFPTLRVGLVDREDNDHNVMPGEWRSIVNLPSLQNASGSGNTDHRAARKLREYLRDYIKNIGAV